MSKHKKTLLPRYVPDHRPDAIIVDIDGTIAELGPRSPYDHSKVHLDIPREHVIITVQSLIRGNWHDLIFLTGRKEECRKQTKDWLNKFFDINYALHMRADDDNRPDYEFKREVYETLIQPIYNVMVVFDDRPSVIRNCWKPLGLPVFNCGVIDEEF